MLRVESFRQAASALEMLLEMRKALHLKPEALKMLRGQMDRLEPVQKAFDATVEAIETNTLDRKRREFAKSEVDSSAVYSRDFFVFGSDYKPSQTLEQEDHARTVANVQAIRDAIAAMPSNFDASSTGINVQITDYSGGQRTTVNSTSAQDAARGSEEIAWPADLAPGGAAATQNQLDADEFNRARGLDTNFARSSGGRPATTPNGSASGASSFAKRR